MAAGGGKWHARNRGGFIRTHYIILYCCYVRSSGLFNRAPSETGCGAAPGWRNGVVREGVTCTPSAAAMAREGARDAISACPVARGGAARGDLDFSPLRFTRHARFPRVNCV